MAGRPKGSPSVYHCLYCDGPTAGSKQIICEKCKQLSDDETFRLYTQRVARKISERRGKWIRDDEHRGRWAGHVKKE